MAKKIFIIDEFITLEHAVGNDGTWELDVPDICDLTGITAASFKVIDDDGIQLFEKTLSDGITVNGANQQQLDVEISAGDVQNEGSHKWQLSINTPTDGFSSIGAGEFCIISPYKKA